MKEIIEEALLAVENINNEIYEQLGYDVSNILIIGIEPAIGIVSIEWLDQRLWDTEEDGRRWIEAGPSMRSGNIVTCDLVPAHNEPLEPYIRVQMKKVISEINKLKL